MKLLNKINNKILKSILCLLRQIQTGFLINDSSPRYVKWFKQYENMYLIYLSDIDIALYIDKNSFDEAYKKRGYNGFS